MAAWVRAAGVDQPDLQVIGHSYGAVVSAHLPAAGIRPATVVLLDPPVLPHALMARQVEDTTERTYDDIDEAIAAVASAEPTWSPGDVRAKAEALTEIDETAARAILLDNGDWDGGLSGLADPAAAGPDIWLVKGEQSTGELLAGCRRSGVRGAPGRRPHPHDQGRSALTAADARGGDARRVPARPRLTGGGQTPSAARISATMAPSTGATPPPFASATVCARPSTSCR